MFKRLSIAAVAVLAVAGSMQAQVNPNDDILLFYKLTADQKAAFSTSDGQIADFWTNGWSGDYIDMNTDNNSYPGRDNWSGTDDARITIKAAADETGLYFYMKVNDDTWVDAPGGDADWGYDACDLYFDSKSSEELANGGEAILVNPAFGWALSFTSQQYQVWMGSGVTVPNRFGFNYYDDLYFTWSYNSVQFNQAAVLYNGMAMEVVSVDATTKSQEWFVPWSHVGTGGISGTITAGTQFGWTGGYNDRDGDGAAEADCLRWTNGYDPFTSDDAQALASWGDMEAAEDITISTPTLRSAAQSIRDGAKVVSTQYFTLRGELLPSADLSQISGHSMILQRKVLSNGQVISNRISLR
jgi:hypothetical protein